MSLLLLQHTKSMTNFGLVVTTVYWVQDMIPFLSRPVMCQMQTSVLGVIVRITRPLSCFSYCQFPIQIMAEATSSCT